MKKDEKLYLNLILLHVAIGFSIYLLKPISIIYGFAILLFGIFYVIKNKNRNHEALIVAAYIVGSEVFLRMTGGSVSYEISKYEVIGFALLGMYYNGISKSAVPYWLFLILLIPGIVIATSTLSYDADMRKTIIFNISGPVCLGVASLYTFKKKISLKQMNSIVLSMGLPIVSCMVYLTFYTPNIRDVVTSTESNYVTSGGFGPNQVSTVLGLGMFVFFSRVILESKTKFLLLLNLVIALNISYRGVVTFSRGGMVTGFLMIVLLLSYLYFKSNFNGRVKLNYLIVMVSIALMATWSYSSFQTSGLINKRYSNQDARGREKASRFTGREKIAEGEMDIFFDNPVFGAGVGRARDIRQNEEGVEMNSHDEITRMLAEHGAFGILDLLILIITPLFLFIENKFNLYLFCFVAFWFLTINHAAMRTAAPSFIYSLSLLNVCFDGIPVRRTENEKI